MKIIQRGKLAMLSIAFMIMIAGYLNYKYDPKREENLGKTVRVDSSDVYLYTYDTDVSVYNEPKEISISTETNSSLLSTYISSRDNLFSELETKYKEMIAVSTNQEEIKEYKDKIDELVKKKHLIEVVEGILKAKGINEIVIIPNENKFNVIVKMNQKLSDAQVNLIVQIIKEEFGVSINDIKIIEE